MLLTSQPYSKIVKYIANKFHGHALLLFPAKRFEFTGGLGVFVLINNKIIYSTVHRLRIWLIPQSGDISSPLVFASSPNLTPPHAEQTYRARDEAIFDNAQV